METAKRTDPLGFTLYALQPRLHLTHQAQMLHNPNPLYPRRVPDNQQGQKRAVAQVRLAFHSNHARPLHAPTTATPSYEHNFLSAN